MSEQERKRSIQSNSRLLVNDENEPRYVDDHSEAKSTKLVDSTQPQKKHSFQVRFFVRPVLCSHCNDYIWGAGHLGVSCTQCTQCVHTKCQIFVSKSVCSVKSGGTSETVPTNVPVDKWTVINVKEWLAVVNLHRYAELFSNNQIDGARLLKLDPYELYLYRIRDSYHHKAILTCRDELVHRAKAYGQFAQMQQEQQLFKQHLLANPYKADRHYFLLHTLASLVDCHMCKRPLLGIVHQALLCQHCGLLVHRQCSCTGLPDCSPKNNPKFVPTKHFIVGVSLFDFTQDNELVVPPILVKSFSHIENRAYVNGDDLYDVYRLSSDTTKIMEIKAQLNENGVELTQFDRFDLNTIAAIVKWYLRDLQDSIVPEELYDKLVNMCDRSSPDEFKAFVKANLHPHHFACLKYVMQHLIRVWTYQFKVHGCRYLPDKLFHIFRSILMRPPWERIVRIVYDIDKQTTVVRRLMLECDWGIEIPEYKKRPDNLIKPPPPIVAYSSQHSADDLTTNSTLIHLAASTIGSVGQITATTLPGTATLSSLPRSFAKSQQDALADMPWFWPNLSRDDTILVLKNCSDGSYLVRHATDNSQVSPYTLCVVKSSLIKSIKIFKENFESFPEIALYDIEKPCRFESIQALVAYYSNTSLREYNHNLDIILLNGVSKYKFGKTTEWSIEKLYSSFKSVFVQLEEATKKCEELEVRSVNIDDDLGQKLLAIEAFEQIAKIYREQLADAERAASVQLLNRAQDTSVSRLLAAQLMPRSNALNERSNRGDDSPTFRSFDEMMTKVKTQLHQKLDELEQKKSELNQQVRQLRGDAQRVKEQLDSLKPELTELRKKRENYHMWLIQRGENDDKIQTVLKSPTMHAAALSVPSTQVRSPVSMTNLNESDGGAGEETVMVPDDFRSKPMLKPNNNYLATMTAASMALSSSLSSALNDPDSASTKMSKSNSFVHLNSLNWYMAECSREQANNLLDSKPDGTYLVRPSSNLSSKYVLSLTYMGDIKHLLIEEDKDGCYLKSTAAQKQRLMTMPAINEPHLISMSPSLSSIRSTNELLHQHQQHQDTTSNSSSASMYSNLDDSLIEYLHFKTLTELVAHYTHNSLKSCNPTIDTCLIYPAFYQQKDAF